MDACNFRDLVKNTTEPILIKNVLDWELLKWDLNKWKDILGKEPLQFRQGVYGHTKEPQFETTTEKVTLSFDEFLTFVTNNPNKWLYFDYKYLRDWFLNIKELRKNISWKKFGFPERFVEESTFWLGSKGAHTPLHIDTYGCNIIAQVYGRKRWILFPPHENLQSTRIPYEESSIYSSLNLFSPSGEEFKDINDCRSIVLYPGEVLIVPHRWWHFVENLEIAISINTWVELPVDNEERINESIVQMLISQLINFSKPRERALVINPETCLNRNLVMSIHLTELCINNYKAQTNVDEYVDVQQMIKNSNITIINSLSKEKFKELILQQKKPEIEATVSVSEDDDKILLTRYLNAMLDNHVVTAIKSKLME